MKITWWENKHAYSIQNVHMHVFRKSSHKKVKEKTVNGEEEAKGEEENDDDDDDDELVSGKQIYVTSADVRDHLRQVWQKDQQVLRCLFHFLSDSGSEYPTDAFFIEVVPVPPSKFRPVSALLLLYI